MVISSCVDFTSFALLPNASNGQDGMICQQREGGQLSIINNKLTELHPHANEFVPTESSPNPETMWPSKAGGCAGPPGFEHSLDGPFNGPFEQFEYTEERDSIGSMRDSIGSIGYLPSLVENENGIIHDDAEVAKIKADLADLMIDEDGELVRVSEDCSSDGSGGVADLDDFLEPGESSSAYVSPALGALQVETNCSTITLDNDYGSSSSASSSREPSPKRAPLVRSWAPPVRSWSDIATPKDKQATPKVNSSSTDGDGSSGSSSSDDVEKANVTARTTPTTNNNNNNNNNNNTPRTTPRTHRRSRSKQKFNFASASTPYTPFPTPNITPGTTPKSNCPTSQSTKQGSRDSQPLSAKNGASYITPRANECPPPPPSTPAHDFGRAPSTGAQIQNSERNQLRSLHNLARLGSYENFEAEVMKWLATRKLQNVPDPTLELDSEHIFKHLDL